MPPPSSGALGYAQFGVQTTFGTLVPATRRIPCNITDTPNPNFFQPDYQTGNYEGALNPTPMEYIANISIAFPAVMPADMGLLLDATLGKATPTVVDTTGQKRVYNSQITAAKSILSIERFDGDAAYSYQDFLAKTLAFNFASGAVVSATLTGVASKQAVLASPANLSPTVQDPHVSWKRIWAIDPAGAAYGTTTRTGLISGTITIDNGLVFGYGGNNQQNFSVFAYGRYVYTLTLGAYQMSANDQLTNFLNGTEQAIQIELRHNLITAAYQGFKFNASGPWRQRTVPPGGIGGINGMNLALQPKFNSTLANSWAIEQTNLVATY